MLALLLGLLLLALGIVVVSLVLGIVYNWYLAALAAPLALVLLATWLLLPTHTRRR